MSKILCAKISSSVFTYSANKTSAGGTFVTERSTLDFHGGLKLAYGPGSVPGFVMISAKTCKEVLFLLTRVETDRDGDVTAWVCSVAMSSYNQPGGRDLQFVEVHILNT